MKTRDEMASRGTVMLTLVAATILAIATPTVALADTEGSGCSYDYVADAIHSSTDVAQDSSADVLSEGLDSADAGMVADVEVDAAATVEADQDSSLADKTQDVSKPSDIDETATYVGAEEGLIEGVISNDVGMASPAGNDCADAEDSDGDVVEGSDARSIEEPEASDEELILANPVSSANADDEGDGSAISDAVGDETDETLEPGTDEAQDPSDELAALLMAAEEEGISNKDLIPLIEKIIQKAVTGDPMGIAETLANFGLDQFLTAMLGTSVKTEEAVSLQDVLAKLDLIESSLSSLQTMVKSQELNSILTNLMPQLNEQGLTPSIVFKDLKGIDDDYNAGGMTKEVAEANRLYELTTVLGIPEDSWAAVNNPFDLYVQNLWRVMTEAYPVAADNGGRDLTLMQILYEHLRTKYHWEHQSYDEWSNYQARYVGLLTMSLTLEKASLQARIKLVNDENKSRGITELLMKTQDRINQLAGYEGKNENGEPVNYPGLFSEKTWASQYWMYKPRDDSERYYWVPGHEVLFYSEALAQKIPWTEKWDVGLSDVLQGKEKLNSIHYIGGSFLQDDYSKFAPTWDYWEPFARYKTSDTLLPKYDQLKMIASDYGGKTSLWTIFFSKDEGNFKRPTGVGADAWYFLFDPNKDHPVKYYYSNYSKEYVTGFDTIPAWESTKIETHPIWYYSYHKTWATDIYSWVAIGVKHSGSIANLQPESASEVHTATIMNSPLWRPSQGDLVMDYDATALGNVCRVLMDGVEIDPSHYTVRDGQALLLQSYMSSLAYGGHEMVFETENGTYAITFSTQADDPVVPSPSDEDTIPMFAAMGGNAGLLLPQTGDRGPAMDVIGFAFASGLCLALAGFGLRWRGAARER